MTHIPDTNAESISAATVHGFLQDSALSTPVRGMRTMWGLISGYCKSNKKKACVLAGALAALTVVDAALGAKMGFMMKDATDAFLTHGRPHVLPLLGMALLALPGVAHARSYFGTVMNIEWRGWLTDRFENALKMNNANVHIHNKPGPVQNPDQIVSEVIRDFTGRVIGLGMGAFSAGIRGVTFLGVLASNLPMTDAKFWMIAGGAAAIAFVHTKLFQKFARPLNPLTKNQYQKEGDFRGKLKTMTRDAGNIAAYGQNATDHFRLSETFGKLQKNSYQLAAAQFKNNFTVGSFTQVSHLMYFLAGGAVSNLTGLSWGTAQQMTQIFTELENCGAWIGNVSADIEGLKAQGKFLTDLATQIELAQNPNVFYAQGGQKADIHISMQPRDSILLENIVIEDPASGKEMMILPKQLEIKQGDRILVTGKSGCGKSSLLRVLTREWYYGRGNCYLPQDKKITMAKPYVLPEATLAENLAFGGELYGYTDAEFKEALDQAELGYLKEFLHETQRKNDKGWESLSDGERQRLAFARVFLQDSDIIILDEATSAMDDTLQDKLSSRMLELRPHATIIGVAHGAAHKISQYYKSLANVRDDGTLDVKPIKKEQDNLIPFPRNAVIAHLPYTKRAL